MKRIEYKMEKYTMENLEQFFRYFLYDNELAIGQIFMINANSICKWAKKMKNGYYYNEYDVIDSKQSDVYFVVKYIGNGYIQEMLTGETMLLGGIHNFECEDKPNELVAVNECTNVENLSCPASVDGSDFFANNIGTWKCAATMIAGAIPLASMVNTLVISRDLK